MLPLFDNMDEKGKQCNAAFSISGAYRHIKRTTNTTITSGSLKVGSTYRYKIRAYVLVNGEKVYSTDVESDPITIE